MRVLLGPRAPEAKDHAEVVFEKLGSRHVLAALAEMDLGPVLEARRLDGGRALEAGRLPADPALDFLLADGGIAPDGLARRPDVATALEPEVVVEDVAPLEHAHPWILSTLWSPRPAGHVAGRGRVHLSGRRRTHKPSMVAPSPRETLQTDADARRRPRSGDTCKRLRLGAHATDTPRTCQRCFCVESS